MRLIHGVQILALGFLVTGALGCPQSKSAGSKNSGSTPDTSAGAEAANPSGDKGKADGTKKAKEATPRIPAGVEHVKNLAWHEGPAPTDIPVVKQEAANAAFGEIAGDRENQLRLACKAGTKLYQLDPSASRVGFISFKNEILTVPGKFNDIHGYATLGEKPRLSFWANALTVNTGNPGRDARLAKLFFQVEDMANAVLTFDATKISGLEKGLPNKAGESIELQIAGKLGLHGSKVDFSFPLRLTRSEGEKASFKGEIPTTTLLPFTHYGLLPPLKALMAACNHKSIGGSVELFFDLKIDEGCAK